MALPTGQRNQNTCCMWPMVGAIHVIVAYSLPHESAVFVSFIFTSMLGLYTMRIGTGAAWPALRRLGDKRVNEDLRLAYATIKQLKGEN